MTSMWHDSGLPSFLGFKPNFSFHELPEIHQEAPSPYTQAMVEMHEREELLGAVWFRRNAEQAHVAWLRHRPWWL